MSASRAVNVDLPLDASVVEGEAAPPASSLAGGAAAGVVLWRAGGVLLWVDAGAQQVVAGCDGGLLEVLAADARSLGTGRSCAMVERVVAARLSGWVRARSQSCAASPIVAVTVIETVRAVDRSPVDLARRFQLSEKELEIVKLVTEGLGNRAIGYRVGLATPTVGMYLTRIFRKTGAIDRQDLTRLVLTDLSRNLASSPQDLPAPMPATPVPVTLVAMPPLPAEPPLAQPIGAWRSTATRTRGRPEGARRWRGP